MCLINADLVESQVLNPRLRGNQSKHKLLHLVLLDPASHAQVLALLWTSGAVQRERHLWFQLAGRVVAAERSINLIRQSGQL